MKRRNFLSALLALPFAPRLLTEPGRKASLRVWPDLDPKDVYLHEGDQAEPPLPTVRVGNYRQISSKTVYIDRESLIRGFTNRMEGLR